MDVRLPFSMVNTVAGLVVLCMIVLVSDSIGAEKVTPEGLATQTIGRITATGGLDWIQVENVGLVVGLKGTGSNPRPSIWRTRMFEEMTRRGVSNPGRLLSSSDTALVLVRTFIPPGASQVDKVDAEVVVPPNSSTISLRHGLLLEVNLSQTALLGNRIREGVVMAKVAGPVVVSPDTTDMTDSSMQQRGRVLGGVQVFRRRDLKILVAKKYQNIVTAVQIENSINRQFRSVETRGSKGAATAKRPQYIDLVVDRNYRHNLPRYLAVVRNMTLSETNSERNERAKKMEKALLSAETFENQRLLVALVQQLEGMGNTGKKTLIQVLNKSQDSEVRFFVAESLAYLGESSCAQALSVAAREEPAFRVFALTALTSLGTPAAFDALLSLLDSSSAELRYGAFRALYVLDSSHPRLNGRNVANRFFVHEVPTQGPPLIHVARSFRPELVLFGMNQQFVSPLFLKAGNNIQIYSDVNQEGLVIKRFGVGRTPDTRKSSSRISDVIDIAVELGASYSDVVGMLAHAEAQGNINGVVAVDTLPRAGRLSARLSRRLEKEEATDSGSWFDQLPGLFSNNVIPENVQKETVEASRLSAESDSVKLEREQEDPSNTRVGFFAKIFGRSSTD